MDQPLTVLADAPTLTGEKPPSRMQVGKVGRFKDRRYGEFTIAQADFDAWKKSLALHPEGQALVDFEHDSERGGRTEAAGWITGLDQKGKDGATDTPGELWADVEWTSLGESAIKDKRYRFMSPAYGAYTDESGRKHTNVLTSVALTNKPFLRNGMPSITLSADVPEDHTVASEVEPELSDSRRGMTDLTKIAKALKLDDDADEAKILAAVAELAKRPEVAEGVQLDDKGQPVVTLAQALEVIKGDDKHTVLSTDERALFLSQADTIKELREKDADRDFEGEYSKALNDPKGARVDAKDETKALWKGLYEKDAEGTSKLLAAQPHLVNGKGSGTGDEPTEAPAGVHDESFKLDQAVKARMAEHTDEDYRTALNAVQNEVTA